MKYLITFEDLQDDMFDIDTEAERYVDYHFQYDYEIGDVLFGQSDYESVSHGW